MLDAYLKRTISNGNEFLFTLALKIDQFSMRHELPVIIVQSPLKFVVFVCLCVFIPIFRRYLNFSLKTYENTSVEYGGWHANRLRQT